MEGIISLLVFAWTCHCTDSTISVSTPDKVGYIPLEPYGVSVESVSHLRFRVKSPSDAHVGLYDAETPSPVPATLYEIVLGGWSNMKSVIRNTDQGPNLKEVSHRILSNYEFKPFWVSWGSGVKVGSGTTVGENTFLHLNDNSYAVKYIAIYTAWGSTGEWEFEENVISSSIMASSFNSPIPSISLVTSDEMEISSTSLSSLTDMIQLDSSTFPLSSVGTTQTTLLEEFLTFETTSNIYLTPTSILSEALTTVIEGSPTISSGEIVSTPVSQPVTALDVETSTNVLSEYSRIGEIESSAVVTIEPVIESTASVYSNGSGPHITSPVSPVSTLSLETLLTNSNSQLFSSTTPVNSQTLLCGCRCLRLNVSTSEIQTYIDEISKALLVPKHHLSSTHRKKTSAHDKRRSSQSIGAGAVVLAILPIVLVLFADLQNLFRMFGKKEQ